MHRARGAGRRPRPGPRSRRRRPSAGRASGRRGGTGGGLGRRGVTGGVPCILRAGPAMGDRDRPTTPGARTKEYRPGPWVALGLRDSRRGGQGASARSGAGPAGPRPPCGLPALSAGLRPRSQPEPDRGLRGHGLGRDRPLRPGAVRRWRVPSGPGEHAAAHRGGGRRADGPRVRAGDAPVRRPTRPHAVSAGVRRPIRPRAGRGGHRLEVPVRPVLRDRAVDRRGARTGRGHVRPAG